MKLSIRELYVAVETHSHICIYPCIDSSPFIITLLHVAVFIVLILLYICIPICVLHF